MKLWAIFLMLTICAFTIAEVVLHEPEKASEATQSTPKLEDLAVREGEYKAVKIERVPASAPILPPNSKVHFIGGCRDSYGRTYGPQDSGYRSCIDDNHPHGGNGPFAKRKALGIGIIFKD